MNMTGRSDNPLITHFLCLHQLLRLEHPFLFVGVDELLDHGAQLELGGLDHLAGLVHLDRHFVDGQLPDAGNLEVGRFEGQPARYCGVG